MKRYSIIIMILVFTATNVFSQLKVKSTGQVDINGQAGSFSTQAPRVTINSSGTTINSTNTGLTLYNSNTTLNNWTRFHFATKKSDNSIEDFVSLAVQYKDRSTSYKGADFHIATLNRGYYASRFAIYNNPNDANDVKFFFNTGYTGGTGTGRGVWLDDSGSGEPTFRPNRANYGYLGTSSYYWYRLYVKYAYYDSHSTITSDKRRKKDIKDLDKGTLSKLNKVRGVKYKLKNEEDLTASSSLDTNDIYMDDERPSFSTEQDADVKREKEKELKNAKEKEHFGFIAQELMEIFPEVVEYDSVNDKYGIKYTALIPIIVESMQEQQDIIDAQSLKLRELEQVIEKGTSSKNNNNQKSANISSNIADTDVLTNAFLYQNTPNPFTYDTEIKYFIPENAGESVLYVFNLQGTLIMSKTISNVGSGSITINGSQLNPGMYVYSLLIDGKEVDTKRMILTK